MAEPLAQVVEAAEKAAAAMYRHAELLGLTDEQARALADAYFPLPSEDERPAQ